MSIEKTKKGKNRKQKANILSDELTYSKLFNVLCAVDVTMF